MKTSRLAVPANPCGGSRLRALVALCTLSFCAPASALSVAWNPNPESDIASYQLSYGTSPGVRPTTINAGAATSVAVNGLQPGTTYYFAVTATNQSGLKSPASSEISYLVPTETTSPPPITPPPPTTSPSLIPTTGWTLRFASSEETIDEDGRAARAFDGNPNTYWITRWLTNTANPPHDLQIDTGKSQSIQGFLYLPRQDGWGFGNIGQYEFYVSADGTNWGSPVATGSFSNTNTEKQVTFPEKTGRYIWLKALTDLQGGTLVAGSMACVAELNLLQGTGTVTPPANQAPVAAAQSVGTNEDIPVAIKLSATDADGNPLTYSIVSSPSKGTLSGTAPNLTYTPAADYFGSDSFTFRANDGSANSNTATVSITITPVNDAPVASSRSVTTAEDTPVAIVLSATDKDSPSLNYTVVTGPSKGTLSGSAPNLTYTPAADYFGSDSFTFRADDGSINSNTATISITVTPVNDPPVTASASVTTARNTPVAVILSATDKDSTTLSYVITANPSKGTLSGTAPHLTYSPLPGVSGSDSFSFRANDGSANSNTSTVSITITSANEAPVARSASVTTDEDTPCPITLSASDPDGNPLTYVILSGPSRGGISGSGPNLTYTPYPDQCGTDIFTFKVNDGTTDSATATVTIEIIPVNDAPVARPVTATTPQNTPAPVILTASDKDSGSLSYSIVSGPANGTLSGSPPDLVYRPAQDFSGSDSFTFRASDGHSFSNTASVTITVTPVTPPTPPPGKNTAPSFVSNPITGSAGIENQPYDGSLAGSATDPDSGDTISYSITSGPAWLSVSAIGKLSGTPPAGSAGTHTFTVRATDNAGASAESTLHISIEASADLPLPWQLACIGDPATFHSAAFASDSFTLQASGPANSSQASGCFVWQTAGSESTIVARLSSVANGGTQGLMIRDSMAADSPFLFIGTDSRNRIILRNRSSSTSQTSESIKGSLASPNAWLCILRKGRSISAYTSTNGTKWSRITSVTNKLGINCYIGLSVSGSASTPSAATFSDVTVK